MREGLEMEVCPDSRVSLCPDGSSERGTDTLKTE